MGNQNLYLRQAKAIHSSNQYIAYSTGRTLYVMDKNFNLLDKYVGFDHAYDIDISKDERLLLLGSTMNHFYLVNLETKAIEKIVFEKPYNGNPECQVRFAKDSKRIYAICYNEKLFLSCLRLYDTDDLSRYQEVEELKDKYLIFSFDLSSSKDERMIILGSNHGAFGHWLIGFNGMKCSEYCLGKEAFGIRYCSSDRYVLIKGIDKIWVGDESGMFFAMINESGVHITDNQELRRNNGLITHLEKLTRNLFERNDIIRFSSFSLPIFHISPKYNRIIFLGKNSLCIYDMSNEDTICLPLEEPVVVDIYEIDYDRIAIYLWGGIKIITLSLWTDPEK